MNKIPQHNQQMKPRQYKYSPKPGDCALQHLYLKINTGCHARENPSEETISESSQISELHETMKLLKKSYVQPCFRTKAFIYS